MIHIDVVHLGTRRQEHAKQKMCMRNRPRENSGRKNPHNFSELQIIPEGLDDYGSWNNSQTASNDLRMIPKLPKNDFQIAPKRPRTIPESFLKDP